MPRAPSVCTTPGCTAPAPAGHSKCDTHRLAQRKTHDAHRPNAHRRGYDRRWRATRTAYLAANPRCVVCDQPATDVDHIDGKGPSSPRGHDWTNLQAMCHACHTRKTNTHDGGGWRKA